MAFLHRPLVPEGRAARVLPCEGAVPCAAASRPWVLFVTILASAMAFIDGSVVTIAHPGDAARARGGARGAAVGGERLHAVPRGADPRRRRGRRPLRAAAAVPARHRGLRARLARLRAGARGRGADRGAAGAGDRRGDDGAAEPRHHLGGVPARAARSGDRHLGRGERDQHRARAGGRRVPRRRVRLAGGVLDQPAAGGGGGGARPRPRAGEPVADGRPARLGGRGARRGGGGAADARADGAGRAGPRRRPPRPGCWRRGRWRASGSWRSSAGPRRRWCRSGSSPRAPSPGRT